ncbi:hypothetical protein [Actinocorallia aurantiaca]|uniref:Secreted protein n=1 Tax=Actinocorallia aurantiaca TaxID=46204 RepID=A0ABN3U2H1_9ACTN
MIVIIAITCTALLFLAAYLWLTLTFGFRARGTVFHSDRENSPSRRRKRTLWVVTRSASPPAGGPSPEQAPHEPENTS